MNTIRITVVSKDGIDLIDCPQTYHLPCPFGTVIDGRDFYFHSDDLQQSWKYPPQIAAAVLPAVSFPVAFVKSAGHDLYAIADQDESPSEAINQILSDLCNTCCEASPGGEPDGTAGAPGNIIPTLLYMSAGDPDQNCDTGTCTYSYYAVLPTNGTATYNLNFACNGVLTSSGGTKFTTIAAALAWAVANLGAYGSWALSGNRLAVSGSTCSVGSIFIVTF